MRPWTLIPLSESRASKAWEIAPQIKVLNVQFRELADALFGFGARQRVLATGHLCALNKFGHQELTGDIEDRRYPALPDWYGDFHGRS